MNYLAYSGNSLINARLPEGSAVYYPPPAIPGIPRSAIAQQVVRAFEQPLGMPPLSELVNGNSKVLIAFDDNCQPFPATSRPDFRQLALEALLPLLYRYGVEKKNIRLICAIALHRKMKPHELRCMVGDGIMKEFYPQQLDNFDAEAPGDLVHLGATEQDEPVEISRFAAESDLVIYLDAVQIPLNGGHKSVGVGLAGYKTIACHHAPQMTEHSPHVMQPDGSEMHASIERIGRVVQEHCKIMVLEAPMNGATYPPYLAYLAKPSAHCNLLEKGFKSLTPYTMALLPEPLRRQIFRNIRSAYQPLAIHAGSIDTVHSKTLEAIDSQLAVEIPGQFDTMVFGLPDLSPYAVDARINPVLVVSDVLGYVFNWFYDKPLVKPGGTVIILNPVFDVFHEEYHVAYRRFYDEVLAATKDPFEMQRDFQEKFAYDRELVDCYRSRYAHHGFHPFTVWYWAAYPLKYLSQVILVGPKDDRAARRLGVSWAPNLAEALAMSREASGGGAVAALTIPPFLYVRGTGNGAPL